MPLLEDYMNMVRDLEQGWAPGESNITLTKRRERLRAVCVFVCLCVCVCLCGCFCVCLRHREGANRFLKVSHTTSECVERHNQALSARTAELQDLRRQLSNTPLETAQLRASLAEKDVVITVRPLTFLSDFRIKPEGVVCGPGSESPARRETAELERAAPEKDQLSVRLLEWRSVSESALTSPTTDDGQSGSPCLTPGAAETRDLSTSVMRVFQGGEVGVCAVVDGLQCDGKLQKQQLADTQQLLQTVQVELQVHEQIRDSTHTGAGEGRVSMSPLVGPGEGCVCADSGTVDLSELLSEVHRLHLQLERSVQTNTALLQKLEQQLLTRSDAPSTININYLLPTTDEGFKSEKPPQHSRPGSSSPAHDSGSSVGCSSPAPSRLVPGHRLWADGHVRHVLGLVEDYSALRKQAKRLTADMNTQLHEGHSVGVCVWGHCQALSAELEQRDGELGVEKRNSLKRDKTIQGLSLLLKEKEKKVEELYGNLEEKQKILAKTREALHKAQFQKHQACSLKQEELNRLQQTTKQLSEDLHSTKNSSQTLKHRLEVMDRENKALSAELEQRDGELSVERRNSLKRDKTIQGLSLLLKEKEEEVEELYDNLEKKEKILAKTREALHKAQLQKHQDYMNMVWDLEQDRAPGGSDLMLTKLREKLREKEKALEIALDEKFVAVEEKENEVHMLQLSVWEKEREVERLNILLSHNEETINEKVDDVQSEAAEGRDAHSQDKLKEEETEMDEEEKSGEYSIAKLILTCVLRVILARLN
ncbi:uncharacterized protein LOC143500301 isoform X1 [Brachyhypopomus gauderio]|uniref:uncharacterized protein LOC143500301 isoform X1 n=1 Tax=Brachyhypopomus gauderio TaxID=698409 RepID=UPI004043565F